MYANESVTPSLKASASLESRRTTDKLLSLAMTNFVDPSVLRLYKVKAPLKSASSVLFYPSTCAGAQRSVNLLVADPVAGKIVRLDTMDGRYQSDVITDVEPRDMCLCGPDCLALVDSNEWGSCVKVISVDTGSILTTWGHQLNTWTPRAITTTNDAHLVISNIHPQATSRLTLFTADGKQVRHFGRAVGPGDLTFKSPVGVASEHTSGRILATDADNSCVKVFDARCNYVAEFGNNSTPASTRSSNGSGNGSSSAMLDRPVGVCCDSLGNAIVCDAGTQRIVLFSRDGRYLCNLLDFRSPNSSPRSKWRPATGDVKLLPVCVGLSSPGSKIAVALDDNCVKSRCFRKLIVCGVAPEL